MKLPTGISIVSAAALSLQTAASPAATDLLETLRPRIAEVIGDFDRIPADRKRALEDAAAFVSTRLREKGQAMLTFICTHNSRRSHLAQVWAQAAARYYGLDGVRTFSGGTEATACNPRTVAALRRAGFSIPDPAEGPNPVYLVQYAQSAPPLRAFSKIYDTEGNPREGFAAMMCCDHADAACPVVRGAAARFPVHYEDPKKGDGTPGEAAGYDARCRQIASEMFYIMSRVGK